MKKITIKDIAKMANVSPTTVSLVLNKKPSRISDKTKDIIFSIAKEYNYLPNLNAKGLVSNKTNMIGLIIPDIENPFFAGLAKVVEEAVDKLDYSLILFNTNDHFENDIKGIRLLNMRGVDAYLIVLSNEAGLHEEEIKNMLKDLNKPFVLIDRTMDKINSNQVAFDNHLGQYMATKHMIKKGFKNIGYIASPRNSLNGEKRLKGYLDAINESNLRNDLIEYGDYRFKSGYKLVEKLLNKNIDSLVVANDIMAFGAIKKLNELKIRVPEDISVIGYDDLIYSSISLVSLTTVRQDQKILGEKAVELLFNNIKDEKYLESVILKPELIKRNT